jgi:hypothetical protein
LLRGQPVDGLPDGPGALPTNDLVERIGQRRDEVKLLIERERRPRAAIVAGDGIYGDAAEPATEGTALVLIALDVPKRPEEDLRRDVLGQAVVTNPCPDEAVDLAGIAVVKLAEGGRIGLRTLRRASRHVVTESSET